MSPVDCRCVRLHDSVYVWLHRRDDVYRLRLHRKQPAITIERSGFRTRCKASRCCRYVTLPISTRTTIAPVRSLARRLFVRTHRCHRFARTLRFYFQVTRGTINSAAKMRFTAAKRKDARELICKVARQKRSVNYALGGKTCLMQ